MPEIMVPTPPEPEIHVLPSLVKQFAVTIPLESILRAATEDVAVAVDVAIKKVLEIERSVQAVELEVPSVNPICGPLEDATVSAQNGVEVAMPTLPIAVPLELMARSTLPLAPVAPAVPLPAFAPPVPPIPPTI